MFDLSSNTNRELVRTYDVTMDIDSVGVEDVARRAVFVDKSGTITCSWVADDPGVEPEYDEVEAVIPHVFHQSYRMNDE